jgi:hypothetical protein
LCGIMQYLFIESGIVPPPFCQDTISSFHFTLRIFLGVCRDPGAGQSKLVSQVMEK